VSDTRTWWLSFIDKRTNRNMGVAIVHAMTGPEALARATQLGLIAGDKVRVWDVTEAADRIPASCIESRVFTKAEAQAIAQETDWARYRIPGTIMEPS
jgi:hypothetical protein